VHDGVLVPVPPEGGGRCPPPVVSRLLIGATGAMRLQDGSLMGQGFDVDSGTPPIAFRDSRLQEMSSGLQGPCVDETPPLAFRDSRLQGFPGTQGAGAPPLATSFRAGLVVAGTAAEPPPPPEPPSRFFNDAFRVGLVVAGTGPPGLAGGPPIWRFCNDAFRVGLVEGVGTGPPGPPLLIWRFRSSDRTVEPVVGGQSRAFFFAPPQTVIGPTDPPFVKVFASRKLLKKKGIKRKQKLDKIKKKNFENEPHQAGRVRDSA
jgi:hypothetical protein